MVFEKFLLYTSGILSAEFSFAEDAVERIEYDLYTAQPSEPMAVLPEDFAQRAYYRLWKRLKEQSITAENCIIDGIVYKKYKDLSENGLSGELYVDMSSPTPIDIVVVDGAAVAFLAAGRNESIALVRSGFEPLAGLGRWKAQGISQPDDTICDLGTFMVPMRDGIELATSVVLPQREGEQQYPTILIRTCYGRNMGRDQWNKYARRGYAVVVQDVRGRDDSQGEWIPFANEIEDGGDTLEWIAAQSWSNRRVGMLGGSYLGHVQWAAAASGSPYLKALVSQVAAGSPFVDLPRRGGTFGSGILAWSFMVEGRTSNPMATVRDDWDEVLAHRPIRDIPQRALGHSIPFYDMWMAHPDNDEFWDRSDWSLHGEKIDVPALYISGWFDDDGPGTTQAWEMNRQNGRKNQRLLMGPWLHKTNSTRRIHNYQLAENALIHDLDLLYLRWFDHFLKGVENGVESEAAVQYYQLGEERWCTDSAWPPQCAEQRKIYLDDGSLSWSAPQHGGQRSYICDPADPFPYKIDVSENECAVPEQYTEEERRGDVLIYTSEPMDKELAIAGDSYAYIYASSSAADTDWVVRLTDVAPDGTSVKLCDGIIRARYRESFREPKLLETDEVHLYKIRLTRIAHTFRKGHAVRLQVASGASNLCFANSQTGGDECSAVQLLKAEQTIYHGGERASFVELPVKGE